MEKELICASSERDSAHKKMLKMKIEVDEANQLTTEAVIKKNNVEQKMNHYKETVHELREEIQRAKDGHSEGKPC